MIEILLATTLSCLEAQELISDLEVKQKVEHREELIETIKQHTKPECYEGSEHNS